MIVVMAGLPGTGKTSLARAIAARLDGVVLSKDEVRAAAFPDAVRDYTDAQDDLAMEMVYQALAYVHQHFPQRTVLVDGRTYSKRNQVERCLAVIGALDITPKWIECLCDEETARTRLTRAHPSAANRNFELYRKLRKEAEPLAVERFVVDTGTTSPAAALAQSLRYLGLELE